MTTPALQRTDARRALIIDAAREAFFRLGYAGTSMSAIAAAVGGSKTTFWNMFPQKQDLFLAVADDLFNRYVDAIQDSFALEPDISRSLRQSGRLMLAALTREPVNALIRLAAGESGRFPELGERFLARGIGRGWGLMQSIFDRAVENGQLMAQDTQRAAQHFIGLCQSNTFQRVLMGGAPPPDEAMIAADVDAAVDAFMAIYGNPAYGRDRATGAPDQR
jgi:AcrR family transcriptional regulator